ncbi:MAG: TIGR04076 family protein [Candidatus Hodarchaeota archaeon]
MTKIYRIIARVHELRQQPGKSPCRLYKVGEEFDLSKLDERAKICRWAFNSLFPFLTVLEFGGALPWEPDPDRAYVACPDPHNIVVFELRRVGELEDRAPT